MATTRKKKAVPEELMPAEPAEPSGLDMDACTVNGKPIPTHLLHAIPYENTDQGRAERAARPGPRAVCSVGAESFEKELERMEDEPWHDSDPFKEKVDALRAAHPDKEFHMLSKRVMDKRGKRGWEILADQKGDPESVGGMLVGVMPKTTAARRNRKYRQMGNEALQQAQEAHQVEQEKIIRDSGRGGLAVLPANEVIEDYRNPNRSVSTGLHTQRGEA